MKLVLASSSKNRQDILNMIGLKYEVIVSNVDEISDKTNHEEYVMDLSKQKALAVKKIVNEKCVIVAVDTIITMNDKIYEKPKSLEEAYENIKEMRGNATKAITGVTIIDLYQDKVITYNDVVTVKLKDSISDDDIRWYVNNECRILTQCGYTVLGKGAIFIDEVVGDYNAIFGLSPSSLYDNLKKLGYKISDFD